MGTGSSSSEGTTCEARVASQELEFTQTSPRSRGCPAVSVLSRLHPLNGSGCEHGADRTFQGRGEAERTSSNHVPWVAKVCSLRSAGATVRALPSGLRPQAAAWSARTAPPWMQACGGVSSLALQAPWARETGCRSRGPGREKLLAKRSAATPKTRLRACGQAPQQAAPALLTAR